MRKVLQPLLAVALGLALGLGVTWLAGENPWHVFTILVKGAFGSSYDLGMTLFYATPLIFTGLSVAVAFHAGLFNIGAEGQLTLGALAAAAVGAVWPGLWSPLAPVLAALAALLAGTLWGAIPGWLRARRGSHEVINTIMLNFVAAGLSSYVALYLLKNPDSQNPETRPVGAGYLIHQFAMFGGAPVSLALPLAFVVAIVVWVLLWRTVLGFEIRAVGQSESAARAAGIDPGRIRIIAMCLAGGLAGLVGVGEVLGNAAQVQGGFFAGVRFHRHRGGAAGPKPAGGSGGGGAALWRAAQGRGGPGPGDRARDAGIVAGAAGADHPVGVRGGAVELAEEARSEGGSGGSVKGLSATCHNRQGKGMRLLAVTIQSDAAFPLTPALSLREREIVPSAGKGSLFSKDRQTVVSCSLSPRERVRVRGNMMINRPHPQAKGCAPAHGCIHRMPTTGSCSLNDA